MKEHLQKIDEYTWEIPKTYRKDMVVPARFFAHEKMLDAILSDRSLEQLINMTALPGIQKYALAMPDMHEGYGFPIGGVATFDLARGIISPGGIGYDINCGVRLLKSELTFDDVKESLENLGRTIFSEVPSGVGRGGRLTLKGLELERILQYGAKKMIEKGYGKEEDLKHIESRGRLDDADPLFVSDRAKERGQDQIGTMGAGNHFVEVEKVSEVFDKISSEKLGLFKDQIVVLIHTGSRGLGHQIATDYIRLMMNVMPRYHIELPDRELACVPFQSKEGQNYFSAMACGANFAWANRQMITWEVRKAFKNIFGSAGKLDVVYDVAHNIGKIESFNVQNQIPNIKSQNEIQNPKFKIQNKQNHKKFLIHRKGATRAYPEQPVIIPGSMGAGSYVLMGQEKSLEKSFGSTCHGAGRKMSRTKARKMVHARDLRSELKERGIVINAGSNRGLSEEAPLAYKDVDDVVNVVHNVDIAKKVVRMRTVVVIKG